MGSRAVALAGTNGDEDKNRKNQIAQVNEEIEEIERKMTPDLRKATNEVRKWFEKNAASGLKQQWQLGKMIQSVKDNPSNIYGSGAVESMAKVLQKTPDMLNKAAKFFSCFTVEQLDEIIAARTGTGDVITYSHIDKLCTIESESKRNAMLARCIASDWTPEELVHYMAEATRLAGEPKRVPHAGGRKVKIPKNIVQLAANFKKAIGVPIRNNEQIYAHPLHSFVAYVKEVPSDKVTPEMVADLVTCENLLKEGIKVYTALQPQVMEARMIAEAKMNAQAQAQAARDADIIDVQVEPSNGGKPKQLSHRKAT